MKDESQPNRHQSSCKIYVLGDSHTGFFGGSESLVFHKYRRIFTGFFRPRHINTFTELLPVFRVFHLGPSTAWHAASPKSSSYAFKKLKVLLRKQDIPPSATILLVFGEIDTRCHIPKTVLTKGKSVEEAVAATVERFLKLPIYLKEHGYEPVIWLPVLNPILEPTDNLDDLSALPAVGSQALRDEITKKYCEKLRNEAATLGFKSCGFSADLPVPQNKRFLDEHHLSQNLMPHALKALVEAGILPADKE